MTALFEKDLRLLLVRKSSLAVFLLVGVVFTASFAETFAGAYMTLLGTLLALSTLSYDDSDNCMSFLFILPCTKKQYVMEKYLFIYGFSFVAGLVGLVVIAAVNLTKGLPLTGTMLLEILVSEIPLFLLVGGLMIPLQLKFGPEKSRLVFLVIFGAIAALGYILSSVSGAGEGMKKIAASLDQQNPVIIVGCMFIGVVVVSIISFFISVRILEKKEF